MIDLLPMWPIWLALAVIIAAVIVYCAMYVPARSHRPTRHVGVLYCEKCRVLCDGSNRCWCCREEAFDRLEGVESHETEPMNPPDGELVWLRAYDGGQWWSYHRDGPWHPYPVRGTIGQQERSGPEGEP